MKGLVLPLALLAVLLTACAEPSQQPRGGLSPAAPASASPDELLLLNRLTWGANASSAREIAALGEQRWLERQLNPPSDDGLPPEAGAQVAAMVLSRRSTLDLVSEVERRRREMRAN